MGEVGISLLGDGGTYKLLFFRLIDRPILIATAGIPPEERFFKLEAELLPLKVVPLETKTMEYQCAFNIFVRAIYTELPAGVI